MTTFLAEDYMPTTANRPGAIPWPGRRAFLPGQVSRGHGTEQEPDTIVTDWDDDPGASRSLTDECTDHGDLEDAGHRMPEPSAGWVLFCGLACIALVAACAVVAHLLTT
jgi:hypothetical protein